MIFCGCSKKDDAEISDQTQTPEPVRVVLNSTLEDRDGILYENNLKTPYTGVSESFHKNGNKKREFNYKDGKLHGILTAWYWDYVGIKSELRSITSEGHEVVGTVRYNQGGGR